MFPEPVRKLHQNNRVFDPVFYKIPKKSEKGSSCRHIQFMQNYSWHLKFSEMVPLIILNLVTTINPRCSLKNLRLMKCIPEVEILSILRKIYFFAGTGLCIPRYLTWMCEIKTQIYLIDLKLMEIPIATYRHGTKLFFLIIIEKSQ